MGLVTFMSDFGQKEEWVAIVKGVIKKISPQADILDISHEISSFNVNKGALVLKRSVRHIEANVHLAVIDPAVGSKRRAIAIETRRGDKLVGPDNGLLLPAAKLLGIKKVIELSCPKYFLKPVSPTFHARDIFAPVTAHLENGESIDKFGNNFNPLMLKKPDIKNPVRKGVDLILKVLETDKYGTARLNLSADSLKKYGFTKNKKYKVKIGERFFNLKFVSTFSELQPLEAGLIVDSSDQLSIFLNKGSASEILNLNPSREIRITIGK